MENKTNMALSDVERNKELFEYEMTEVILRLKGEFTKLSGEDLNLEEVQFDAPKVAVQVETPDVSVEHIAIDVAQTEVTVSGESFAIARVKIPDLKIECPAVPILNAVSIGTIQVETLELDCSTAAKVKNPVMNGVWESFEIPKVEISASKINCPAVPVPSAVSVDVVQVRALELDCPTVMKVKKPVMSEVIVNLPCVQADTVNIAIKAIPDVKISELSIPMESTILTFDKILPDVQVDAMKVVTPNASITLSEIDKVSVDFPEFDIAQTAECKSYYPIDVTIEQSHSIDFPKMIQKVSVPHLDVVTTIDVRTVDVPSIRSYEPVTVGVEQYKASGVMVPKISTYSAKKVVLNQDQIIPPVKKISKITLADIVCEKKEISVPAISPMKSPAIEHVKITKLSINCDYPTIDSVRIPPVVVKEIGYIPVPQKPDFTSNIREIIESVV